MTDRSHHHHKLRIQAPPDLSFPNLASNSRISCSVSSSSRIIPCRLQLASCPVPTLALSILSPRIIWTLFHDPRARTVNIHSHSSIFLAPSPPLSRSRDIIIFLLPGAMDEPGSRVLRVRRADVDTDSFVLLNVTSQGSRALDLKIVGTDGDDVYVATSKSIKLPFISSSIHFTSCLLFLLHHSFLCLEPVKLATPLLLRLCTG